MTRRIAVLLDVSRPFREGMPVWPGDAPFRRAASSIPGAGAGPGVTTSSLTFSSHAGTHVDAPFHVDPAGADVESLGLERFVGPALVIDARGRQALDEDVLSPEVLAAGARLLFRTDYARGGGAYGSHIPYLTPRLAGAVARAGVPLVGVDGPSVDPFESETLEAHRLLAAAGVAVLENLDLSRAEPGGWWLIALPLALPGSDAAPVRAVLARFAEPAGSD